MDLRKLKTLIDLVSESNISELEITEADGKVRIVKADPAAAAAAAQPVYAPAPAAPVVLAAAAPAAAARLRPLPHPPKRLPRRAMWSSRRWSAPSTALPARTPSRSPRSARP